MFPKKQTELPNKSWKTTLAFSTVSSKIEQTKTIQKETPKPKKPKPKRGNTKREISRKTAEEVRKRDRFCIIANCGMIIDEIHHAFYGIDADYSTGRNKASSLVGLCKGCHDKLHSRGGNEYRQFCKTYLYGIQALHGDMLQVHDNP